MIPDSLGLLNTLKGTREKSQNGRIVQEAALEETAVEVTKAVEGEE